MSDLAKKIFDAVEPDLRGAMTALGQQYLGGFQDALEGAQTHVAPAVAAHLEQAAKYKWSAMQAKDTDAARMYVDGMADEIRSAKTILKSDAVAMSDEAAEAFASGFEKVLDAVGSAVVTGLGAVVKVIATGAVEGLIGGGGGGLDLSSIFPRL